MREMQARRARAGTVKERAMAEPWDVTDKMHAYLIERADQLADHADHRAGGGRA